MKKILYFLFVPFLASFILQLTMTSCTDNDGDGIDSILWTGSKNPEDTCFRNPVWEPSLEAGTVVKGASMYVAVSATSQWAPGLTYICKTLTSSNLMNWTASNDAFSVSPTWASGRVNSMSIDYAKTVVGATYWMFYTMEDSASIGVASATTAAGPYTDRGEFLSAASIGSMTIKNPFFIVSSTSFYLCYSADDGTYIQPVKLSKSTGAKISGTAIKISGTDFKDIAIVRASSSRFYLMGTVSNGKGTEIHYAMASKITGPYVDKNGTDLTTGSKGEQLIVDGTEIVNAENPMRGFFNTTGSYLYLAYNATQIGQEMMASGYARRPMFLTPFKVTEDGWLDSSCQAKKGWTFPRFE